MNVKVSKVRKIPQFPKATGNGLSNIFQLIIGILIWIGLIITFLVVSWALYFNSSLASLLRKPASCIPLYLGIICTIFLFPVTVFIILLSFIITAITDTK